MVKILIMADCPKAKSFNSINSLLKNISHYNIEIIKLFFNNIDDLVNNNTLNLKKDLNYIVISLEKNNLNKFINKYNLLDLWLNNENVIKIFIFGAESELKKIKNTNNKLMKYIRTGVSKTSKKFKQDIINEINR